MIRTKTPYPTNSLVSDVEAESTWNPVCHITYDRASWVKLIQPPSEYSFDEAMLLCQESPNTWLAWIPDYGEVLLDKSDFYC